MRSNSSNVPGNLSGSAAGSDTMSAARRLLLLPLVPFVSFVPGAVVAVAVTLIFAAGCTAPPRIEAPPPIHPLWELQMSAGLDASDLGNLDAASGYYRKAVQLARREQLPNEEMAFSIYRLGESIRVQPELAEGETALALFGEAHQHFASAYGPHHPVLIPVLIRIAAIQAERGNAEAAAATRATADAIAARFFPERHFLRERFGTTRPAAILHPLEMLQLVGEPEEANAAGLTVQGSH
jgi:hypothetical protein